MTVLRAAERAQLNAELVHLRRRGVWTREPLFGKPARRRLSFLWLLVGDCIRRRGRARMVHINGSWAGNLLPLIVAAKLLGIRIIISERSLPRRLPRVRGLRRLAPWRIRLAARMFRRRVEWHLADVVLPVGETVRRRLINRGLPAHRSLAIPNGVNVQRLKETPGAGERIRKAHGIDAACVVGSMGRFSGGKGFRRLIHALAEVDRPEVALLLVGDGPERPSLEAEAERVGVRSRVFFVGWRDDINAYLNAMDIFALPSDYEGVPRSILEAMATARPVVATEVGGVRDVVHHGRTGYLVPAGDQAALIGALQKLIDQPELRQRFGRAGRKLVESCFSEGMMVRRTLDVYEQLLNGKRWPARGLRGALRGNAESGS